MLNPAMKAEIEILYLVVLKYKYTPQEMMELRYSTEASDRVKYEMIVLSAAYIFSKVTLKTIETPLTFSDFVESIIVLPNHIVRESYHSVIKV